MDSIKTNIKTTEIPLHPENQQKEEVNKMHDKECETGKKIIQLQIKVQK